METFIVEGRARLSGSIRPSGNKNEALPAVAACLLGDSQVTLENLPWIGDVRIMLRIAQELGVSVEDTGNNRKILHCSGLCSAEPNATLCKEIRGSFLFVSPLLHRFGKAKIPIPGGDAIGRRRLDTHILALEALGAKIDIYDGYYDISINGRFKATDILLDESSVMATESAIMAAVVADGKTTIYNAACEPHVQNLCRMLNTMGGEITGIGSNYLSIVGKKSLGGCSHKIAPDHTEIGSLIGLAAVTGSSLTLKDSGAPEDLGLIPLFFLRLGIRIEAHDGHIFIPGPQELRIMEDAGNKIPKIDDAPWPGFPADLTSIMTVVATQCEGEVLIFEKLFESRLFWIDKLIAMGARIVLCDPHRAIVSGVTKLRGAHMSSPDIRAGMALLIAALCAEGTSEINNIQQIDRGYESIDTRLNAIGANIRRVT